MICNKQIGEHPFCEVNAGVDFLKNDQHENYGLYCIEDAGLDSLKIVHKYVKDGAEIVRRLNEFTKKNEDFPGYVSVDLSELTKHVVKFLRPGWQDMAQGAGIKYRMNTDGLKKVSDIKGNPSELREVVLNIINNALDAMPKGGTICFNVGEDEDNVHLSISDTGAGMTEEVISKIFDPFFTSKERGTGLGLSVVYGIVKRHGGRIHVSSTVETGSVFYGRFHQKMRFIRQKKHK